MDYVRSAVVGVFENRDQAQCAVDELRKAGFARDQVNLDSGQGRYNDLMTRLESMGIPDDEVRYCGDALRAGNYVVSANTDGRYDDAFQILEGCGSRTMKRDTGSVPASSREPGHVGQIGAKKDLGKWKEENDSDDPGAGMDPDLSADTWTNSGDIAKKA